MTSHTSIENGAKTRAAAALAHWNGLPAEAAAAAILPCCGSQAWARALAAARPIADLATLLTHSESIWSSLPPNHWQQAFDSHPRLGETRAEAATPASLAHSRQEQSKAAPSQALCEANSRYEDKFHRIFLLCANDRTEPEILAALEARMANTAPTEWLEAGEQQRQITRLRLERWLSEPPA